MEQEPQQRTCQTCQQPFSPLSIRQVECSNCLDDRTQREIWPSMRRDLIQKSTNLQKSIWQKICPPEFQTFDPSKIRPPFNAFVSNQAFDTWGYGSRGLLFSGVSGTGKSCTAWRIAKREFNAGRSIAVLDSTAGIRYAKAYSLSARIAADWVQTKIDADLLIADDLFKAKLSDSLGMAVFTVFDKRTESGKPIICTLNDSPDTLKERLGADRGPAINRRLQEYCTTIIF